MRDNHFDDRVSGDGENDADHAEQLGCRQQHKDDCYRMDVQVFPIICGEINFPSNSCTTVQTMISFTSINGEVTKAMMIAGVIAIVGPRYGTMLVHAATRAKREA